ncbi:MAG: beta-ketoacyl-ACP synthase III [Candidatus Binatus sp.]|uniref:beta-ketoacyl-ACP synthase III n=1 Tax=Candidatus Binatus sp. TaxID=2811406 RepID=UPI00272306DB|nr:beta-ketoacyl-ACP synthase III [Candidatus Binatus sp.]MDO8433885.1 beta-ketoacyl-ACP synthase III [Candidatus Binatus sp.]
MGSRIVATGRALPRTALSNKDLERYMDTSDEWIKSRTGINQRYAMRQGESLAEIATAASRSALDRAGLKATDLDAIIVGTVSSEYAFPSFACQIQHQLGITSIPAFDVAAACSGFIFAISVADSQMRAGDFKRVLVVGADALSTMVDWNDRRTAVLFGDGAGAVVMVSEDGNRGVLSSLLRSSGEHWHLLSVRATGVRSTIDSEVRRCADDAIQMKGPELFKIAVKSMEEVSRLVADRAGVKLDEIDLFVPHQANLRIISAVADRLGMPHEKVFTNIDRFGNTSAASVPIALDEALEQGRIHDNSLVMLNACGGGLTWGANLIRW